MKSRRVESWQFGSSTHRPKACQVSRRQPHSSRTVVLGPGDTRGREERRGGSLVSRESHSLQTEHLHGLTLENMVGRSTLHSQIHTEWHDQAAAEGGEKLKSTFPLPLLKTLKTRSITEHLLVKHGVDGPQTAHVLLDGKLTLDLLQVHPTVCCQLTTEGHSSQDATKQCL